jgi:hypothetical protein
MTDYTTLSLEAQIDALGQLKAQIADLESQESKLKKAITGAGAGAYEGSLFRVTVTISSRETLDMEAVRKHLSPQFIRAHTRASETTTVRVTARKGE